MNGAKAVKGAKSVWSGWYRGAVVTLVLGLGAALLAGCGKPSGVDGDLTNQWPAMAEAKTATPVAGVCYDKDYDTTWYGDFTTVDCAQTHKVETVYVGQFTGADADRTTPPLAGSTGRATAYAQCEKAAADYLGDDWHGAKVYLGLTLPSGNAWTGKARWYRCDVEAFDDVNNQVVHETGSVKDGLRGNRPLAITCLVVSDDGKGKITDMSDADCAKPHNGEFAGVYLAPDRTFPTGDPADKLAGDGCEGVVAKYLGFSGSTVQSQYLGWMFDNFDQDQWNLGDRSVRCYALAYNSSGTSINGVRIVGSVKGLRGNAPKKG